MSARSSSPPHTFSLAFAYLLMARVPRAVGIIINRKKEERKKDRGKKNRGKKDRRKKEKETKKEYKEKRGERTEYSYSNCFQN